MLPIDVMEFGKTFGFLIYFLIGMGFGAVLEVAGFGDSRKLSAQFYLKDMTVLKTMFTGIVVACVLIFSFSAFGLLDFAQLAVNPTYLSSEILGGLIMGVGFIIGGFCPGTSIVAASTLKVDGIVFFVGTAIGAGLFGETVSSFYEFWNASFTDRWILPDWLGWSTGATVLAVVLFALAMFYLAELAERYFNGQEVTFVPKNTKYIASAAVLVIAAVATLVVGQPDPDRKWQLVHGKYDALLSSRAVYVHPLEYVKTWNDWSIKLVTLDMRSADEFEKFHLSGAARVTFDDFFKSDFMNPLLNLPPNGLVILVSSGEADATKAWEWLKALGVTNVFVLEGGIENWLSVFAKVHEPHGQTDLSRPSLKILEQFQENAYTSKIKLKTSKRAAGACS